jgi:uroporphyrinogen-III synthase
VAEQARKRVLVTRSVRQGSELAERLTAAGFKAELIPAIELAEPTSFAALDEALGRLAEFDWVLFTSANAVEVFGRRVVGGIPSGVKVAAIGPAPGRAVASVLGRGADLVPEMAVAESMAEALLPMARPGVKFLLVRAEVGREELPERLRAAGVEVVVAAAYRNVVPESSIPQVRAMFALRETWPDAITFTSSSTASNLLALLEVAGARLPEEILRVSIGPVTSETLRGMGYPAHAEAEAATIEALVEAVRRALG